MKPLFLSAALLCGFAAYPSFAADMPGEKNLSLALANQLAQGAIQACSANHHQIAVTVVDRAGVIKAMQRMDNAGPHTVEASRMKAYTALTTKNTTEDVMKSAQANAGAANLRDIPGFLLLGGGVPVKAGEQIIGAIGVGGAPGGHIDQQCALEAIKHIQSSLDKA
ncbi:GlcG/HbpS family heme-binding protein [Serratia ureilytica]|uniref:GlcG/HbpS family heme-binding protein n=1 Tax=Serratia ureilytica TaxID=300181 RepID=UPI00214DFD16|nr:heme-binding protein [Serratia ureilytica]UUW17356.1 heme-binding protein [Serratia ureilytica]